MNKLENARKNINEIDLKMAELYERRMDAVIDVINHKIENGLEIFDSTREKEVIEKNLKLIKNDVYKKYYEEYIQFVMDNSKKYQKVVAGKDVVGYQGTKGAFSHIASTRIFPEYKGKAYETFEDVFKAVVTGEVPCAVLPFENSFTGEIGEVIDLLSKYDCYIKTTYDLKIDQNLVCNHDSSIDDIKEVFSHSQALSQSKEFLNKYDFKQNVYANTALAAEFVSKSGNKSFGAVASKETAELYNLKILAENINTSKQNTTRFVIIENKLSKIGTKFNAIFTTSHNAGDLAKVLGIIANEGYNVENIKSRSIPEVPWEYYFYIEIDGNINDQKTEQMIEKIKENCEKFKIIGCYNK